MEEANSQTNSGDKVATATLSQENEDPSATQAVEDSTSGDDVSDELQDVQAGLNDSMSNDSTEAVLEEQGENKEETHSVADNKQKIILKALKVMEENLSNVIALLEEGGAGSTTLAQNSLDAMKQIGAVVGSSRAPVHGGMDEDDAGSRVVEGVFNGQHMVGSDGKIYSVPPNYASKSKLVEGDMLKLTISNTGSFIYKQIGPIERKRVVGELGFDHTTGEYYATSGERRWSIIKASVTYFKGEANDEIILLVPQDEPSKWAAVENVIRKNVLS